MVYGANGYTGRLVAQLSVRRGERPVLSGRSAAAVRAVAAELGLPARVVDLGDAAALRAALRDVDVVAHCAGPFAQTSAAMVAACLATKTSYVDITGEIDVLEAVLARDAEAKAAGVVLLPGGGFDVVPTDCLAAMLARALPTATHLELAFVGGGGLSHGTATTALRGLGEGGRARVDGELRRVPLGWKTRSVRFGDRSATVTSVPWGDVATAYRSTGIPTIVTYTVVPGLAGPLRFLVRFPVRRGAALAALPLVRPGLGWLVDRMVHGPDEAVRSRTGCEVWGEARDRRSGRSVTGWLTTPNGYALTADAVLRIVRHLLAGAVPPGAHTPSTALGADFVRELDGVTVHEVALG
jgi:saccharopine dehydrogenase (NAD+, L-lysine-forming)